MTNSFDAFRALVFADPQLQQRLIAETDPEKFLQLVAEASRERGCGLNLEQAREALRAGRQVWLEQKI